MTQALTINWTPADVKTILDTYNFNGAEAQELNSSRYMAVNVERMTNSGHDFVTVLCNEDDFEDWNALSMWSTDYPLDAYVQAVKARAIYQARF